MHIQEGQHGRAKFGDPHRRVTIVRDLEFVVLQAQQLTERDGGIDIVVHDEHAHAGDKVRS
jgi:hypothetical protein